jgi:hypothetical protein
MSLDAGVGIAEATTAGGPAALGHGAGSAAPLPWSRITIPAPRPISHFAPIVGRFVVP